MNDAFQQLQQKIGYFNQFTSNQKRKVIKMQLDIINTYTAVQTKFNENYSVNQDVNNTAVDQQGYVLLRENYMFDQFVVKKLLKKGSSSTVYLLQNTNNQQFYVIKIARQQEYFQDQLQREVALLQLIQQTNSCISSNYITSFCVNNSKSLIMQNYDVNLKQLIILNKNVGFPFQYIKSILVQVLNQLQFLEQINLVHGNINPTNIVLNLDQIEEIRLIDYSCSFFTQSKNINFVKAHLWYRAPEQLSTTYTKADIQQVDNSTIKNIDNNTKNRLSKIDYFSLGCLIYELHTGRPLFPGDSVQQLLKMHIQIINAYIFDLQYSQTANQQQYETYKQLLEMCGVEENSQVYPSTEILKCYSIYDQLIIDLKVKQQPLLRKLIVNKVFKDQMYHKEEDYDNFMELIINLLNININERWTWREILGSKFML